MAKVTKVTREQVEELHYKQGLKQREVAQILGVHQVSLNQAMRKLGMRSRTHWIVDTYLTKPQLEALINDERMNTKEVAAKYKISDATVQDLMHKYGLTGWNNSSKDTRWRPGDRVGNFEILQRGKTVGKTLRWRVKCLHCGEETYIPSSRVMKNKSCGCLIQTDGYFQQWGKMIQRANTTHGFSKHPLYHSWLKIWKRCNDPDNRDYKYYGARGITCEFEDVADFIYWAVKKGGWQKGKHCHRIDNDGPYSPDNCIFMAPGDHSRLHWKQKKAQQKEAA